MQSGTDCVFGKSKNHNKHTETMANGFSHHYQLDESTFVLRGVRSDLYFLSHFSMKFLCANRKPQMGCHVLRRHVWCYLGFWSGNLFLIAPFPDLCLLVLFYTVCHVPQKGRQA